MKKLLICLFVVFLTVGCVTTSIPACEQNKTFSIEFTNSTNDPYDLYINDQFQETMNGKTKATYDISSGYWSARMEQVSGYTVLQTIDNYSGTYDSCTDYYIVF